MACVIVGITDGPGTFAGVEAEDPLYLLAQIGVIVLLLLAGLKLDLRLIRPIGPALALAFLGLVGTFVIVLVLAGYRG